MKYFKLFENICIKVTNPLSLKDSVPQCAYMNRGSAPLRVELPPFRNENKGCPARARLLWAGRPQWYVLFCAGVFSKGVIKKAISHT